MALLNCLRFEREQLRKKIENMNDGESHIETVWGRGYVMRDPVENKATA